MIGATLPSRCRTGKFNQFVKHVSHARARFRERIESLLCDVFQCAVFLVECPRSASYERL